MQGLQVGDLQHKPVRELHIGAHLRHLGGYGPGAVLVIPKIGLAREVFQLAKASTGLIDPEIALCLPNSTP